jgi:ubiquinol-cytochrome c reductase cytochrome c1 subunit
MRRIALFAAAFAGIALGIWAAAAQEGGGHAHTGTMEPRSIAWSFNGAFGHFDRAQLQRGYLVYKEVCAACHGMKLISYRNFAEPGGLELSEAQVKALASAIKVKTLNDKGEEAERSGTPADTLPEPYANEAAARAANNGALPPDLSVIVKARHGGADYIYSILTGYTDAPAGMKMALGMNYNPYFAGGEIAMPAPLGSDDLVTFADGTKATKAQMAQDVTAWLTWTSEPRMEERKRVGAKVMAFTFVLMLILFVAYRRLWRDVAH